MSLVQKTSSPKSTRALSVRSGTPAQERRKSEAKNVKKDKKDRKDNRFRKDKKDKKDNKKHKSKKRGGSSDDTSSDDHGRYKRQACVGN